MDGNGRWAEERGMPRIRGHERGVDTVHDIVNECITIKGVEQLTLFAFSMENWKRPQYEVTFLMHLLKVFLAQQKEQILSKNIHMVTIGDVENLPEGAREAIRDVTEATRDNTGLVMCLAINYGARQELARAARLIAEEVREGRLAPDQIDEACVERHLWTSGMHDPDLLIRTAGEMRLSNFLLWQCSYTEFYVTSVCWPDFSADHLHRALNAYARRTRKFGGLKLRSHDAVERGGDA